MEPLHRWIPPPPRLVGTVGCRQGGLHLILDRWLKRLRPLRLLFLDLFGRPILRTDRLLSLLGLGWIALCFPFLIHLPDSVDLWKSSRLARRLQMARYLENLLSPFLRRMDPDSLPIPQTAHYYLVTVVVRLIFRWLHELARLAQCLLELMCHWCRSLGRIEIRPRLF